MGELILMGATPAPFSQFQFFGKMDINLRKQRYVYYWVVEVCGGRGFYLEASVLVPQRLVGFSGKAIGFLCVVNCGLNS